MTASLIIDRSAKMLGLTGVEDQRIQGCAINALNRIYAELSYLSQKEFSPITSFGDNVELEKRLLDDVVPYGVASLIAASVGDSENMNFYGQIYNLKRKKQGFSTVTDVLPTVQEG